MQDSQIEPEPCSDAVLATARKHIDEIVNVHISNYYKKNKYSFANNFYVAEVDEEKPENAMLYGPLCVNDLLEAKKYKIWAEDIADFIFGLKRIDSDPARQPIFLVLFYQIDGYVYNFNIEHKFVQKSTVVQKSG